MSSENYRNLVHGRYGDPGWQTPGYPTSSAIYPNINNTGFSRFAHFVEVASAEITAAQFQNSPFTSLPGLSCTSNNNCPGQTSCESGRCLAKTITKPQAPQFSNGTRLAYTENFEQQRRPCGAGAEGKLSEVSQHYKKPMPNF